MDEEDELRSKLPRKRTLEPGATSIDELATVQGHPMSMSEAEAPTMLGISPEAGRAKPVSNEHLASVLSGGDEDEDVRIGEIMRGYELLERLGGGSMGIVYRARHVEIGKLAAVKVLRPSLSNRREVVERFLQEARAASRIDSPHVVGITDFGETADGAPFFIMDLLEGQTLGELIRGRERLPFEELRPILAEVLRALSAAHARGVVHRDMKPDNIMLAETSHGVAVKVLDFGIAKVVDEEDGEHDKITRTGMIVGTAAYMSPEQAQSQPLDHRADLYSVGIIAFQGLTGRLPFDEDGFMPMVLAHATKPPPVPSFALRTGMFMGRAGNDIDAWVLRALAKAPDDRFVSAEAMREALESIDAAVQADLENGESSPWPKVVAMAALVLVLAMVAWVAFA